MNSREKTIAGMIGLISLVPAWWTNAQESQGRVLDEITVTAQKRSESLMDVPIALTAFSGEALDNFGVGGTQDLQFSTPSIVYANTGAFAQPYIRGVGSRLLNNGFEPSVATYVDGRYISRQSAFMFDLADVERVEVLKGPQGVVFGRNASAGAIRLITKDVGEAFEGAVKVTAGNYDYRAVSGTVNIPISDTFGMRISGMTKDRDGYAQNLLSVGQSEWDNLNTEALRAKLRWDITERATANLTLGYWSRDDNDGNDTVALGPLQYHAGIIRGGITGRDVDEVATVVDWTNKITELSAELNIKIAFDGFDLTSITTRAEMDDNELSFEGDGTSTIAVDGLIFEETENYSQELQFTSNQDSSLNWLVGAYLYNDETLQDTTIDIGPLFLSQGLQTVETTAWAAFGQLRWQFNDYWALTLGGRYSHEEKDVKVVASQHVSFTVPAVPYSTDEEWNEITPKATLEYLFDSGMIYMTYARGFKSGGLNYPARVSDAAVDPETLDMYELGLKGDFFDNTFRLTAAAYYYDYVDLQVTRAAGAGVGTQAITTNASDAEIYGLDVDINWIATEALSLTGGFSLQESEYQDFLATAKVHNAVLGRGPAGMSDVGFDASGETLLRAPKYSAFLSATYEFMVGDARMPLVVAYSYKGSYNFDFSIDPSTKVLRQASYGLLNARLSYVTPSESWTVSLWGNNLADEDYFEDVVAAGIGIRGSYGAPRTYGVDVNYQF